MAERNFLVFTQKQATFITAGILFGATCIFTLGYLLGQRRAVRDFCEKVKSDAFSDKVKYSLYERAAGSQASDNGKITH